MAKLPDDLILSLPDSWAEIEETPPLSLPEIIAICEKMLPIWNAERFKKPPPPFPPLPFTLFPENSGDDLVDTARKECES
jgi:hypothetical protein